MELRRAILMAMGLVGCSSRAVGPDDMDEDGGDEDLDDGESDGTEKGDDGDDASGDDATDPDSGPISTTVASETTSGPDGCEPGYGFYAVVVAADGDGQCPSCELGSECADLAFVAAGADGVCGATYVGVTCGPELRDDGMCAYVVAISDSEGCQDGVGRPFFVDGTMRVAPVHARDDWSCVLAPELAELDDRLRAELGAEWRDVALAEHASIASFARFVLDLLAVGAPADLVASAQRAMADEIVHARLAFGLASAYLGCDVGPGPLAIDGALPTATSLATIVRAAIEEGCIGETIGAARAEHARRACTDPAVHRVLTVISRDERRHAELAWRFVAWALAQDPSLRTDAHETFARALADLARADAKPPVRADDLERRAHGISSDRERARLLRTVATDVLAPCASELLHGSGSAAAA